MRGALPKDTGAAEGRAGKRDELMKKCKKPARGQRISEGQRVKSLRPGDNGSTGTVIKASRKKGGWVYSVMFDGWYRVAERPEGELEGIS